MRVCVCVREFSVFLRTVFISIDRRTMWKRQRIFTLARSKRGVGGSAGLVIIFIIIIHTHDAAVYTGYFYTVSVFCETFLENLVTCPSAVDRSVTTTRTAGCENTKTNSATLYGRRWVSHGNGIGREKRLNNSSVRKRCDRTSSEDVGRVFYNAKDAVTRWACPRLRVFATWSDKINGEKRLTPIRVRHEPSGANFYYNVNR